MTTNISGIDIVITGYPYEASADTRGQMEMGEDGVKDWRYYYEEMRRTSPLTIYYPICGGGEECISVCPLGNDIWGVVPMRTPMFGSKPRLRYRPVMIHPEKCRKCYICIQACPTGALHRSDEVLRHPTLTLIKNTLKLFIKRRYGFRWVFRKEHRDKFLKNNPRK